MIMIPINLAAIPKTDFPYFTNNSLSVKQNDAHYTGHYLKYIENFNKLMNNNIIDTIYQKYDPSEPYKRSLFLLAVIMFYDKDKKTPIYKNCAQIFNHELYWNSLIDTNESINLLRKYKNELFTNIDHLKKFYTDFIDRGLAQFGSGWLWIYRNYDDNLDGVLDVMTTHDADVPIHLRFYLVIDLWEHAYYVDYEYQRKKYLEKIFRYINWNHVINPIINFF
jgi:Fe-Mn family superoxide dismutase